MDVKNGHFFIELRTRFISWQDQDVLGIKTALYATLYAVLYAVLYVLLCGGIVMLDLGQFIPIYLEEMKELQKRIYSSGRQNLEVCDKEFFLKELFFFSGQENIRIWIHSVPDSNYNQYYHSHDFFEMIYVYKGAFSHQFDDGSTYIQPENKLMLLSLNAKHIVQLRTPNDLVFNLILRKKFIERNMMFLIKNNEVFFKFFLDSLYGIHHDIKFIEFENSEKIQNIICEIIIEYCKKEDFFEEIIFGKLLQLFSEIARKYNETKLDAVSKLDNKPNVRIAGEILEYIDSNYSTVTMESVADRFGYSQRQVLRLLSQVTDKSFSKIVNEIKIKNACTYFEKSGLPLDVITDIVGFCDNNYFYKVFKDVMGITYSKYKKGRNT